MRPAPSTHRHARRLLALPLLFLALALLPGRPTSGHFTARDRATAGIQTGTIASLTDLSPAALDLGNAAWGDTVSGSVSVTNTAAVPLSVGAWWVGEGLGLDVGIGPASVDPGAAATVTVSGVPDQSGTFTLNLRVAIGNQYAWDDVPVAIVVSAPPPDLSTMLAATVPSPVVKSANLNDLVVVDLASMTGKTLNLSVTVSPSSRFTARVTDPALPGLGTTTARVTGRLKGGEQHQVTLTFAAAEAAGSVAACFVAAHPNVADASIIPCP